MIPSIAFQKISRSLPSTLTQIRSLNTAFVGVGQMGLRMCRNLKKNSGEDDRILVHDSRLPEDLPVGVEGFSNIRDMVFSVNGDVDVLLTALPNDVAVRSVLTEFLETLSVKQSSSKGTLFIDVSTVSPSTTIDLHRLVTETNSKHIFVDAPMSGGVAAAEKGSLTFMLGCNISDSNDEVNTINRVEDVLLRMGKKVIHCGNVGMGEVAKLCNNLALAVQMGGICEAMILGEQFGIDPIILSQVMNVSTAKCWSGEVDNPHPKVAELTGSPAAHNYNGGFSLELMLKDMSLALSNGGNAEVSFRDEPTFPLSTNALQLYRMAYNHGYKKRDFSVLYQFLKGQTKV